MQQITTNFTTKQQIASIIIKKKTLFVTTQAIFMFTLAVESHHYKQPGQRKAIVTDIMQLKLLGFLQN